MRLDLDRLTKFATVLAAFAYVTGVIAINTYLHELGIVDFSFAKPKLLLTGILVLFTFLLLAAPPCLLAWALASRHDKAARSLPPLRGLVLSVIFFVLALLMGSAFLCFTTTPLLGQTTVWKVWESMSPETFFAKCRAALIIASEVYTPILMAAASVYIATWLFDLRMKKTESGATLLKFYFGVAVAVVALAGIGYVFMFTRTFYSAIPQGLGGGQPYFQRFAVADQYKCELQQLGIPFSETEPNITMSLPVLHETDTLIAVWLRDKSAENAKRKTSDSRSWKFVVAELDKNEISALKVDPDLPSASQLPQLTLRPCTK